jgi:hypothetical protein
MGHPGGIRICICPMTEGGIFSLLTTFGGISNEMFQYVTNNMLQYVTIGVYLPVVTVSDCLIYAISLV